VGQFIRIEFGPCKGAHQEARLAYYHALRVLLTRDRGRRMAIDDGVTDDVWSLALDPRYFADLQFMRHWTWAENHGLRNFNHLVANQAFWTRDSRMVATYNFDGGKEDQDLTPRLRELRSNLTCECCRLGAEVSFDSACAWDEELEQLLPETRCNLCIADLHDLAKDPTGSSDGGEQVFLPLNRTNFAKFSFEKGAKPMPILSNGKPDGTPALDMKKKHIGEQTLNQQLKKVFKHVIARRIAKKRKPRYVLKKVGVHGWRHGAAMNHKRLHVPFENIAWMLRMSPDILRRYLSHNMQHDPDNVTSTIAGSSTTNAEAMASVARQNGYVNATAARFTVVMQDLGVDARTFMRTSTQQVMRAVLNQPWEHRDAILATHASMSDRRILDSVAIDEYDDVMQSQCIPLEDRPHVMRLMREEANL